MSKKSKHRVGLISRGKERLLFSVRIGPAGDLIIIRKAMENIEAVGRDVPVLTERYSVHPSPNSDPKGSTTKLTLNLQDGNVVEMNQFRRSRTPGWCALVFGSLCAYFTHDRYDMPQRAGDQKTLLFKDDIGDTTFFYFVAASDYELSERVLARSGLNVKSINFGHFWLTILSGFFLLPQARWGCNMHYITSSPRINKGPVRQIGDIESLTASEVAVTCAQQASHFAYHLKRKIETEENFPEDVLEYVRGFLARFSKTPSDLLK